MNCMANMARLKADTDLAWVNNAEELYNKIKQ